MDSLQQIAAQIMTILVGAAPALLPLLTKVAEGAASETGKGVAKKAGELFEKLRSRFQNDKNDEADSTLTLFIKNPQRFESVLSAYLLETLQKHPEWANEIRALLAEPSLQEIVAKNKSVVERIKMKISGSATQHIEADDSRITDVDMNANS